MSQVQIRVCGAAVEDTVAAISAAFPDAHFKILAALPDGDSLFDLLEVTTTDGDELVKHVTEAPDVRSFEVLYSDDRMLLVQLVVPRSDTYAALVTAGIVPQQPVSLRNGWYRNSVTAAHEQLSAYVAALAAANIPYEVSSVTQSFDSNDLLTDRQWEFVTEALERGFYDTPRRCTLGEVAEVLGIELSAASRLRHRAESRITNAYVANAMR
ncbi:helix-turn-helix domain-containing protein [Haloferax sp. S1W]|uniref:helix-turn-helix domain-containing protein n=1 Tax=Haloferax sp. S1W TaxID=3377110 RepID=UPI0037CB0FE2